MIQHQTNTALKSVHAEMPTLELEAIPRQFFDLIQQEQQMREQEKGIQAFCDMRAEYAPRFEMLQEHQDVLGEEFKTLELLWQRLWAEPQDPIEFSNKHYQQSLHKLHKRDLALMQELQMSLQTRSRILSSWRNLIHEVSHRLHLLQKLDDYLQSMENAMEERARAQAQQEAAAQAAAQAPHYAPEQPMSAEPASPRYDTLEVAQHFEPEAEEDVNEKRSHQRLVLGTVVNFSEDEHSFYTGFSENISEGGLFVATYTFLPQLGDRFSLSFSLPDQPTLEVVGEVAWIREHSPRNPMVSPGFGCRFLDLTDEDKERINQYIHKEGAMFMPSV